MRNIKRLFAVTFVIALVAASLSACGGKKEEEATAPEATQAPTATVAPEATATPSPTPAPRDLGGIEIIVGDWFTTGDQPLTTTKQEDQKAYRDQLQADHNFKLTQTNLGAWAEYTEIFITSTMAGDPAADIFIMDPAMAPEPIKQGLMYPLSDLPSFAKFEDGMWSQSIKEAYTINGKTFAFSEEKDNPGLGVFWNKRLFEEAGLSADLLYDLQASGEWTWDKFHELAKQLTVDKNNDGVTDIYGITGWQREIVKAAVFSNGADYVKFNETTGRYENNQKHDDVLAAINLAVNLYEEGLILPPPEGAAYTYFIDAFKTGQAAICPAEWYRNTDFGSMEDDWGFVFFPKGTGPKAKMQTMFLSNVRVMPAVLDAQRADDVAFAYTKWVSPVPGYEDDSPLTDYYDKARDTRAVDETIKSMLEGQGVRSLVYMIPGLSFKHGANEDNGGLGNISAIEIADAASALYDSTINDFYAD